MSVIYELFAFEFTHVLNATNWLWLDSTKIIIKLYERKKKEADRRRGGKTISKNGQEWTLPAQLGQLKTGKNGKGLLQIHLWCPDDLPRLWDRIE